ncbi:MAG: hypothetical protein RLZZ292_2817, partial [Bacteroidota bacterium]
KKLNPKDNVILYPPKRPCVIAFDDIDEFTGNKRVDTKTELFFTYTDEIVQKYFKDDDYIRCNIHVSRHASELYSLVLEFVVASESTQNVFGSLEKGAGLTFRTLDNQSISLVNLRSDKGVVDHVKHTTTYTAIYKLTKTIINQLKVAELDTLRVSWSQGFDNYEILDVDILANQLNCFN